MSWDLKRRAAIPQDVEPPKGVSLCHRCDVLEGSRRGRKLCSLSHSSAIVLLIAEKGSFRRESTLSFLSKSRT